VETQTEVVALNGAGEEADHLVCPCSKHIAICGARTDPEGYVDDDWVPGEMCVLCEAVADMTCPRCGE
jgi:hypothetical protein